MTSPHNTSSLHHPTPTVLVVGATGKTGRRVADRLDAKGVPIRRAGRSAPAPFDWRDRRTWPTVLDGVSSVYLSYQPDLIVPGAVADVAEFARLAGEAGVGHLVLLSGRGEPEAAAAAQAIHASAVASTVLSCAWFDQNFDEGSFAGEIVGGTLTLPVAGDVGEPFVDADDIADAAVEVLTAQPDRHTGATYELTGPRLLTFPDVAAHLGAARGAAVEFTPVPRDVYRSILIDAGVDSAEAELLDTLFARLFDGRNAHVADGVEQILGRPARDFADYAKSAAAQGKWAAGGSVVTR